MSLTDIHPREAADDREKRSRDTLPGSVVGAGVRAFYAAAAGLLLTCSLGVVIWAVTPRRSSTSPACSWATATDSPGPPRPPSRERCLESDPCGEVGVGVRNRAGGEMSTGPVGSGRGFHGNFAEWLGKLPVAEGSVQ